MQAEADLHKHQADVEKRMRQLQEQVATAVGKGEGEGEGEGVAEEGGLGGLLETRLLEEQRRSLGEWREALGAKAALHEEETRSGRTIEGAIGIPSPLATLFRALIGGRYSLGLSLRWNSNSSAAMSFSVTSGRFGFKKCMTIVHGAEEIAKGEALATAALDRIYRERAWLKRAVATAEGAVWRAKHRAQQAAVAADVEGVPAAASEEESVELGLLAEQGWLLDAWEEAELQALEALEEAREEAASAVAVEIDPGIAPEHATQGRRDLAGARRRNAEGLILLAEGGGLADPGTELRREERRMLEENARLLQLWDSSEQAAERTTEDVDNKLKLERRSAAVAGRRRLVEETERRLEESRAQAEERLRALAGARAELQEKRRRREEDGSKVDDAVVREEDAEERALMEEEAAVKIAMEEEELHLRVELAHQREAMELEAEAAGLGRGEVARELAEALADRSQDGSGEGDSKEVEREMERGYRALEGERARLMAAEETLRLRGAEVEVGEVELLEQRRLVLQFWEEAEKAKEKAQALLAVER
eukprot:gene6529-7825_t